jgi:hypothetical protein
MQRIRLLGLALLAVFAFSAVVSASASAFSAATGPLFLVSGNHLRPGETRLLLATAKAKFKLEAKNAGIIITCEGLTLPTASEMQIENVAGQGGVSRETLEFTTCTVQKNGEGCEVEGKTIRTNLVLNLLGWGNAQETGQILVLFEPESGINFVTVKFVGELCKFKTTAVTGTTVGGAQLNEKPYLVGQEADSLHGEVAFPHVQLIFLLTNGLLRHVKAGLNAFGVGSTLTGVALLLVDEGGVAVPWGILS